VKFNFPINNFSAGEWSPRMRGRTDVEQYPRASETITNFIPQMTGGAQYRGGTIRFPVTKQQYIDDAVAGDVFDWKMIPYLPSDTSKRTVLVAAYHLAGANTWAWFHTTGTGAITNESPAASYVSGWSPGNIVYTQVGDLLILTNNLGTYEPVLFYYDTASSSYKMSRFVTDTFPGSTSMKWKCNPWGQIQALDSSVTMTGSATTGSITVTASAAYFNTNMIGEYIRLCSGTSLDGVVKLTGYTSTTVMSGTVVQTLPVTTAIGGTAAPTTFWQQSSWGASVAGYVKGWPRTVTSYQGRIIFGGSPSKPDTLWGSRISSYFDFQEIPSPNTTGPYGYSGGSYAADNSRPFTLTPNSGEVSNIVAMSAQKTLLINTERNEINAYGSNGALGPLNVVFESTSSFGATAVQPVRINNFMTFVQANGFKVRDITFSFAEDQYKSTDLSFVADHFFYNSDSTSNGVDIISEMVRVDDKNSVLFVRTRTGYIFGVTLDRDYQVNAWFRILFGKDTNDESATGDTPGTGGSALAICSAPSAYATNASSLYVLVKREVNGTDRAFIEIMTPAWEFEQVSDELPVYAAGWWPIYLDCAWQATHVSGNTWKCRSGAAENMYRGCTVSVIADGKYIGEVTPANSADGAFTLASTATNVLIGFKYQGVLKTMPIEAGGQTGPTMGRVKRVSELVVRFFRSIGATVGPTDAAADQQDLPFRPSTTPLGDPTPAYTGDMVVSYNGGYTREAQVVILQDEPYPCHVLAIVPQGITYD
jgi:hypothetical protein